MAKSKTFSVVLIAALLATIVAALWLSGIFNKQRQLAANEILERCYPLNAGDKLHYRFKADDIISFDIRRGGDTMMPPRVLAFEENDFIAEDSGEYCLRFGNGLSRALAFEYSVQRVK